MFERVEGLFRELTPAVDHCAIRIEHRREERLCVERDVAQAPRNLDSLGAMVTIRHKGGLGYAATSDLSRAGLSHAIESARAWAEAAAGKMVPGFAEPATRPVTADWKAPEKKRWADLSHAQKTDRLMAASRALKIDARILDWSAVFWSIAKEQLYLTASGTRIAQQFRYLRPSLSASANAGGETQTRTYGDNMMKLGGAEVLDAMQFDLAPQRVAREAIELIEAQNCPEGRMDLVLAPDQMVLQIHESIGHPLELDRILGDERNYAGTSFVTPDMFGTYRYGSEHLNITFDPTIETEVASYGFDDEGTRASREYIIRNGILERPLGGATSQSRANLSGVANERASAWNRPPIDRMSNLNLEPGDKTFGELIGAVENGVYMESNRSWSIDDSRNKFQFGCERARLIKDGALGAVVRNPNYRGISANFWRNLDGVGRADTVEVMGTPFCGKGEPNQVVKVGHATPPCLFRHIDVFGGH